MIEIWKDVIGYEGLYKVSNIGNVKSLDRKGTDGRLLKGKLLSKSGTLTDKTPYLSVSLYKNDIKRSIRVHRLVAECFVENPNNKQQVNHIDGNKKNNLFINLEWVDRKENAQHALITGLMDEALKIVSEVASKKVIVRDLKTNEIIEFKNREKFSLHLNYNKHWFSKSIVSTKSVLNIIRNKGYELIHY